MDRARPSATAAYESGRQRRAALARRRAGGQALVFVALALPLLVALALTCIEVAERFQELAQVEDALAQATRAAVQTFDYQAFADGGQAVREPQAATVVGCAGLVSESTRAVACALLATNLAGVRGLAESPALTAARVEWTLLPRGGTCTFPNGRPPLSFATPALCATLRPRLTGLLGWGTFAPQVDAAATLDPVP